MPREVLAKIILIAAAFGFIAFLLYMAAVGRPGLVPYGTLFGKVTIGPLCPVERLNATCGPADVYSSRSLVLNATLHRPLYVPLRTNGTFSEQVPSDVYSVSLTNCTFLGCRFSLPKTVEIRGGMATVLNISIDTGIR